MLTPTRNAVTIVVETADAVQFAPAQAFIEGLAIVKETTGKDVHFFHVSFRERIELCTTLMLSFCTADFGSQAILQSRWR